MEEGNNQLQYSPLIRWPLSEANSENVQLELDSAGHEPFLFETLKGLFPPFFGVRLSFDSETGLLSPTLLDSGLLLFLASLVSRRSIMRDTVAIPTLTSLLTSEPISDIEVLRENNFSFQPLVLFAIESLYLKRKE